MNRSSAWHASCIAAFATAIVIAFAVLKPHGLPADARLGSAEPADAAPAPGAVELRVAGQLGGNVMDVTVVRHDAYVTVGPRLQVWDVTDPARLTLKSQSPALAHMLGEVAASDRRAYALEIFYEEADEPDACYGVRVFGIAPDHPPRPAGWLPCPAAVYDMYAVGDHAFLATSDGVTVVDAADVSRPVTVGRLPGVRSARSVRVADDLAYVAGEPDDAEGVSALLIFDVRDPRAPLLVGRLDLTLRTAAIDVVGQHVFVVSRACSAEVGLEVIDVGDPTAPRGVGFHPLECGVLDVTAGDGVAHVLGFNYDTMIESVFVFDVSDPASPSLAGEVPTGLGRSFANTSGHVLVACGAAGTHVVDAQHPDEPRVVAQIPTLGDVTDVALDGDAAFATDATGELWSVSIERPNRPTATGRVRTDVGAGALVLCEGHAYVAQPDNFWSGRAGLHVVDVGLVSEPEVVRFLDIATWSDDGELLASPAPQQMALVGNRLFVPSGRYGSGTLPGFWRVDVAAPAEPEVTGFYPHAHEVYGMSVSGTTAFLAAGDHGVDIVDIADDGASELIGHAPTAGLAVHTSLALGATTLAVATEGGGVRLLDVREADAPAEVGAIEGVTATFTAVLADRLFIPGLWAESGAEAGLRVFTIADPSTPGQLAAGALPAPGRVAVGDDLIAVAAGRLGLLLVTDKRYSEALFVPIGSR